MKNSEWLPPARFTVISEEELKKDGWIKDEKSEGELEPDCIVFVRGELSLGWNKKTGKIIYTNY